MFYCFAFDGNSGAMAVAQLGVARQRLTVRPSRRTVERCASSGRADRRFWRPFGGLRGPLSSPTPDFVFVFLILRTANSF